MRSLETFSLLAITFFSSSTVSILLTFTSKGPPVKGATVMLRLLGLSLVAMLGPGLLEELGEDVPGAGKRLCLRARPESVWTPPPPPPPPLSSLVCAGPGSSPLVSLGYIASVPRELTAGDAVPVLATSSLCSTRPLQLWLWRQQTSDWVQLLGVRCCAVQNSTPYTVLHCTVQYRALAGWSNSPVPVTATASWILYYVNSDNGSVQFSSLHKTEFSLVEFI